MDESDDALEEQKALGRIFHALLSYGREAKLEVDRWKRNYAQLSDAHKALLPNMLQKCESTQAGIQLNQRFLTAMVQAFQDPTLAPGALAEVKHRIQNNVRPMISDYSKVLYVLKNAVRDWAVEGSEERSQSYGRICDEISELLPDTSAEILVPGCGLGRLPFELSHLGHHVEGNEFSFYMLVASALILNHAHSRECFHVAPWLHSDSNNLSDADQTRTIGVPDILPSHEECRGSLRMSAGDFAEVYVGTQYQGHFDAVVTCFFLDCAQNVFHFIDIIYSVLKTGGHWINLGPLLYHWADSHTYLQKEELSIEPSLEDVLRAIETRGFKIEKQSHVKATFNANVRSMVKNGYEAVFWTARKL